LFSETINKTVFVFYDSKLINKTGYKQVFMMNH